MNGPAPSVLGGVLEVACTSTSAGWTERTTNGRPIRINATTTPIHV